MEDIKDGCHANSMSMSTGCVSLPDKNFEPVACSFSLVRGKFPRKTKDYQQAGGFSLTDSQGLKEK